MKMQVTRLRETLELLKTAVPRKPTLDILKNVRVKDGQLMATNLDSMVIVDVPEAAEESFLLPYEEVLKMLRYVTGYDYVDMQGKRGKLTISSSGGDATYPSSSVDEFPEIPDFEVKDEADVDGDILIPAMEAALPYAATETERPVLRGVTVLFGGPIEVSAGDGFRMAHIILPLEYPTEYTTILPPEAVKTLVHLMAKTPRTPAPGEALVSKMLARRQLQIAMDGKRGMRVRFSPTVSSIVKLVDGQPPSWLKLIPKDEPVIKGLIFARELQTAVKRVSDVAHNGSGIVRLEFEDGSARISAKDDGSEVSSKVSCLELEGAPNRFALNVKYLTEYLGDKDSIVTFAWTGQTAPVMFQHPKSPRVLIMPMEAKWEKEPPAEPQTPAPEPAAHDEQVPEKPAVDESTAVNIKPTRQRSRKKT